MDSLAIVPSGLGDSKIVDLKPGRPAPYPSEGRLVIYRATIEECSPMEAVIETLGDSAHPADTATEGMTWDEVFDLADQAAAMIGRDPDFRLRIELFDDYEELYKVVTYGKPEGRWVQLVD